MSAVRDRYAVAVPDRPSGLRDRTWRAFCYHVVDGRALADIAGEFGVSVARAGQLVRQVDRSIRLLQRRRPCPTCGGHGWVWRDDAPPGNGDVQ